MEAFERGAVDYLVKPFDEQRLVETIKRLRQGLASAPTLQAPLEPLLEALAQRVRQQSQPAPYLQWIKASVGQSVRFIPVDQLIYLRSNKTADVHLRGRSEVLPVSRSYVHLFRPM